MQLVENIPLDTTIIARLIEDKEDLFLVWQKADFPFNHAQWQEVLDPQKGNIPFLVYEEDVLIGHAALRKRAEDVYSVSFLYIKPEKRSKGAGERMIGLLERYAVEKLNVKELCLAVRTYNPRAIKCYTKCGFKEYSREDTLIRMSKALRIG
jgi:RimJ/RimL family protein N-acetyltransferase